jgi:MSHA biogenesis protein MshQ
MNFSKDTYISITAPITVIVNGSFSAAKNFIIPKGEKLLLDVQGSVTFHKDMNGYLDIKSKGSMNFAKNTILRGDLNSNDDITIAKDSLIDGNVYTKDQLKVGKNSSISGWCSYASTNYYCSADPPPPPTPLHHFQIDHDGTGLTCTPSDVTIWACSAASSGGVCQTSDGGASGTLLVKNPGGVVIGSYPFSISAGDTNVTLEVPYTNSVNVTFDTTHANTTCWDGNDPSCAHSFQNAGFDFDVPNHRSDTTQSDITIRAIKQGTPHGACGAALGGARTVNFSCTYSNPGSGSKAVSIISGATTTLVMCNQGTVGVSLAFDSDGEASFSLRYPDAGSVTLTANYNALSMTGSSSFIAVPAAFKIATNSPYVAGVDFPTTISAVSAGASQPATPNYGKETNPTGATTLTFERCEPSHAQAADGVFKSGTAPAFSNGVATIADTSWAEVGTIRLTARNSNYMNLGATFEIVGSTACIGPFVPHNFQTALAPFDEFDPTKVQKYAYSGQPFALRVIPRAKDGTVLNNYVGSFAKDVTLSARAADGTALPANLGILGETAVSSGKFTSTEAGSIATAAPKFTFIKPLETAPTSIRIRASNADAASSTDEAILPIRTGRLRLSNAFGGARSPLRMPVRAEFWNGRTWVINSEDNIDVQGAAAATKIPLTSLALTRGNGLTGSSASFDGGTLDTLEAGQAEIVFSAPTTPGFIDVAINLGDNALDPLDASCLQAQPASIRSAQPWLRSRYGNCGDAADPSARVTFGIYAPQTRRVIHVRESTN